MFAQTTYTERRNQLAKKIGKGIVLLLGNNESPMNYLDNTYTFRQDSTFLYYIGINQPEMAAIIDIDNHQTLLFGENLNVDQIVWMGSQPGLSELAAQSGITRVQSLKALQGQIQKYQQQNVPVHYLPPYRTDSRVWLHELLGIGLNSVDLESSEPLVQAVVAQREIKSEEEIKEIEQAVDVSIDMHMNAIRCARPGMTEAEVAAEVHKTALAAGGNIAFPIIATINGQVLHNHYHGNTLQAGDLFLLDAGAENKMGYAGDLSSTFPVSMKFSSQQKDIYNITLAAHQAAINALAPGINFSGAHKAACIEIYNGVKALGLVKGDAEEAYQAGAHAMFFQCGTGHMMGLDVHDMENLGEKWVGYNGKEKSTQFGLKSLRLGKELQPGFVLTIEPGIYFIPELFELWNSQKLHKDFLDYDEIEKFLGFGGIRNEEDFLITHDGHRRLGKPFPKDAEAIEAMRG